MITQVARPKTFEQLAGQKIPRSLLLSISKNPDNSPKCLILSGGFGCGKCVLPDTRVITTFGYKKISEIMDGKEGYTEYVTQVNTRAGMRESSHFYKEKNCKVNLLHLVNGDTVNGTDEHRILAYHDGKVDLHKTADLKEGDYILFPHQPQEWSGGIHNTVRAYLIGLWLGDGYYHKGMGFCGTYEMCSYFAEQMGMSGKITKDKRRENLYAVRATKKDKPLFEFREHSDSKYIPEEVFKYDLESRVAFVQGLLDTDGTISKDGCIEFTMKSEYLIHDLQKLLYTLGLVSRVTKELRGYGDSYRSYYWRLRIASHQAGYINLHKYDRKYEKEDSMNDRNIIKVDGQHVCDLLRAHRKMYPFRYKEDIGSTLSGNVKYQGALTERSLIKYKEFYGEIPKELDDLIGYEYVEIESKSETISDVYDLTVPDIHEFYCQGTYNHNTSSIRILARSLNCQHKKANGDACGKCEVCNTQLDQSPFYTEYDSSQLRLETIRALIDTWYVSMSNGYRVICIDEGHLLSKQVQSALLKVFEEPPANTFFCIATTDVEKIISTIRSRSLEITLNTVSYDDMKANLLRVAAENNIQIDDDVIDRIIKESHGHMRNAHMSLDKYNLIGKDQFMELFKSSYDSIDHYFQSITVKSKDRCFSAIDEILQYPLVVIRDDFENYILNLTKSLVTTPNEIVQALGANTLKLIKHTMSDWFKSCFDSDVELQTGLLCLYQLMTDVPTTSAVVRVNPNARR